MTPAQTAIPTPWTAHYDPWFEPTLDYPDLTLYELYLKAANRFPDYPALTCFGRTFTYLAVHEKIEQAAEALTVLGFKPGQVATVCLPNVPQAVVFFYAVNRLGGICNMVHPLSPPEELRHFLRTAGSDYLIILDALLPKQLDMLSQAGLRKVIACSVADDMKPLTRLLFKLTKGRKIKSVPSDSTYIQWQDFLALGQRDPTQVFADRKPYERMIDPKACAVYLHSGGTTGEPKTIMLSSFNFNALAIQGPQIIGHANDASFDPKGMAMVMILPLFHGFGLCMGMHTMLANGMRCILVPQFSPDVLAQIIVKEKPSFIAAVPTLFEGILRNHHLKNADLSCLKAVFCGGDTLTADLKNRFDTFIQARGASCSLREGYGLTETVTVCAVNPQLEARTETVGLPLSDVLMKVIDPQTLATVPNGQDGEFCIHAPTRMIGYLHDEAATANTIRIHADGLDWVHTGDYGFMDDDGYFHFKQRMKRILKVSGVPVFPSQVEDVIASVPGVRLACAIGVPHPYKMQIVKAFVVPENPHADPEQLRSQILQKCEQALIPYAIPKEIEFRDDLPRTKVGKIDFIELERQELAKMEAAKGAESKG